MSTQNTATIHRVVLGEGRPKIIVPLMPSTPDEAQAALDTLHGAPADLIEWRVDHFADPERAIAVGFALRAGTPLPILLTYRTDREGGLGSLPDDAYAALVARLATLGLADAVDVEYRRDAEAVAAIVAAAHGAGLPVVGSFHDFDATPAREDIVGHLRAQAAAGADILKIAVTPQSAADVATLLAAAADAQAIGRPVIAISMGELGLVSRVAAETFGGCATFASTGQASAPGQIEASTLAPLLELFAR